MAQQKVTKENYRYNRILHLGQFFNVDYTYPSAKLLTDVGVDSVRVGMAKTTCKIVYRGYYDMGPPALNTMFEAYIPTRELRSGNQLLVNIHKSP